MKVVRQTIIRHAKIADLPRLAELGLAILKYHQKLDPYFAPAKDAKAAYIKFFRKCIYSRKHLLLVAENKSAVIGYSLANLGSRPPVFKIQKIGHINDMFIEESFRRQGIAKKFLDEIYRWFKKNKASHVHLVYHSKNSIGRKAWNKHGYQEFMSYNRLEL